MALLPQWPTGRGGRLPAPLSRVGNHLARAGQRRPVSRPGTGYWTRRRIHRRGISRARLWTLRLSAAGRMAALGVTATITLGGFGTTAQGTPFSGQTIQFAETNGHTTCFSSLTPQHRSTAHDFDSGCAINALGGALDQSPGGQALKTTIIITNTGRNALSRASLAVGSCNVTPAPDDHGYVGTDTAGFCGKVDITIADTTSGALGKCVYPVQAAACPSLSDSYNLATLAGGTLNVTPHLSLPAGASGMYVITVQLSPQSTNADQGLTATLPFTWNISQ